MSIYVLKQLHYTLIYPYLNYAVVVGRNIYPSNLNKLYVFLLIEESHPKFSVNFLIFLNLITLLNWVHVYSQIGYLQVFQYCFTTL